MYRAEQSFEKTRDQYERLFNEAHDQRAEIAELKGQLVSALKTLNLQVDAFGRHVNNLNGATAQLSDSATSISGALEYGLEKMEATQKSVAQQVESQQTETRRVVDSLERVQQGLTVQVEAATETGKQLRLSAEEFQSLRGVLGEYGEHLRELLLAQRKMAKAWEGLQESMSLNEAQLQAELEQRRQALETLAEKMAQEVASGVREPLISVLREFLGETNRFFREHLNSTHQAQGDFNRVMDRKWEQLLTTLGAAGDVVA